MDPWRLPPRSCMNGGSLVPLSSGLRRQRLARRLRPGEHKLLRAVARVYVQPGGGMLHLRTRGFGDEDVAGRIDREIVRPAEFANADAGTGELAHHFEIAAAKHGNHVRAAVGDIEVRLWRVVREADRERGLDSARPLRRPRGLLLGAA